MQIPVTLNPSIFNRFEAWTATKCNLLALLLKHKQCHNRTSCRQTSSMRFSRFRVALAWLRMETICTKRWSKTLQASLKFKINSLLTQCSTSKWWRTRRASQARFTFSNRTMQTSHSRRLLELNRPEHRPNKWAKCQQAKFKDRHKTTKCFWMLNFSNCPSQGKLRWPTCSNIQTWQICSRAPKIVILISNWCRLHRVQISSWTWVNRPRALRAKGSYWCNNSNNNSQLSRNRWWPRP